MEKEMTLTEEVKLRLLQAILLAVKKVLKYMRRGEKLQKNLQKYKKSKGLNQL